MILVYTHNITPRIAYAMDLVFGSVLNTVHKLTDNKKEFDDYELSKIAYTTEALGDVFIQSNNLLFETDIKSVLPSAEKKYTDYPMFFKSTASDFLGYDLFAMVFYFATRYEEYLSTNNSDEHQRFKAENSIAFQYNCLHIPFLNSAIEDFGIKLKNKFPALVCNKRSFNFLSTIDIDNAFAYAHKGLKRNLGGLAKDVLSLKFDQVSSRVKSNSNDEVDPYNTFELINTLSKESQTALKYFVLIGDYSAYDKNPDYQNEGFRKLLKSLSVDHVMGLHPSYESFNDLSKIAIEKKRLEDVIGKKVTSARCHFLRVKLPHTYREFVNQGIMDDYTMVYASQSGFRTGLCTPFKWFDLEKNEATDLTIHTSVIMEGTLRDYNKLSAANAKQTTLSLLSDVKKHGGEFISIFHNDSFVAEQKEWIDLYKTILKESKI